MSDLSLSLKSSETSLAVPKLRDDGSNWSDYEPRVRKAMGAKGIWRHVEGTARKPMQYAEVNGVYVLANGKTPTTEEQVEARDMKLDEYDKCEYLAQHVILSTTSP